MNNNPVRYNDPTGHSAEAHNGCDCGWQITLTSGTDIANFRRALGGIQTTLTGEQNTAVAAFSLIYGVAALALALTGAGAPVAAGLSVIGTAHVLMVEGVYDNDIGDISTLLLEIDILLDLDPEQGLVITYDPDSNKVQICGETSGGCTTVEYNIQTTQDELTDLFSEFGDPNLDEEPLEDEPVGHTDEE